MKLSSFMNLMAGLGIVSILLFASCSPQANQDDSSQASADEHDEHTDHADHADEGEPTHGGWWCYEHGVPEDDCAMCDSELAAKMRESGDWCEEHNRPDSLCFKCHPENADKLVALYEAKYGKQPPKPTE